MRRPVTVHLALHGIRWAASMMALVVALLFGLGGCASWQAPASASDASLRDRAVSDTVKNVTLSASVLSSADSEQLFGTDIKSTGVQPIWIEVHNHSTHTLWLLRSGTDPSYFSPLEVAWPLHSKFAKKSNARIDAYFNTLDFKSPIPPGAVRSGILFVNPHRGTYVLNVDLLGQQSIYPFTLFLPIPGEHKALAQDALERLAESVKYNYQDPELFRSALEQLPCCASGGDPANMVFVGNITDMAAALIRRGYRMEQYARDNQQRIFERPPDIVVRKRGQGGSPSNWLRMWVAPLHYQDQPVVLVQSGRPLGGRFAVSDSGEQPLHPNVDESRNLLIQDLMYSGGVARLGYVGGVGAVPRTPAENTDSDRGYHSDGLRAVLFFVTRPLAISEIEILDWVPILQQREAEAAEKNADNAMNKER
jgi:hypothetical protein